MNRALTLMCLGALAKASSLSGWGGSLPTSAPEPYLESNFPMNSSQQWYMKETYLLMKPYEDDNDYATKLTTEGSLTTNLDMKMRLEKPDFDWFSGVRIGVGRYLANHDKWDVSLYTTYFYANEENVTSSDRSQGTLLTPLWNPTFDGGATHGKVNWRLNYFTWDLSIGREYSLLKTVIVHPFIGLRTALIYKDTSAKYSDSYRQLQDRFKASDNFWGIGPRLGVDMQFNMRKGWSFLGNLSGALFYGQYNLHENITTKVTNSGQTTEKNYHNKDDRYAVRANLDAGFGIGWETWLNQHTVRLAPSVLFEAACWFDTNQLFVPKSTTVTTNAPAPTSVVTNFRNFRRQGNLILMGFSFNLQADF